MLALFERNEPVDLLTISEELRRRHELDEVGGPATLGALVEEAATAAHLPPYGGIVPREARWRVVGRAGALLAGEERVALLTISEGLGRRHGLDGVGGPATLGALVEEAATAAHLLSYGGIVREKAVLRDLIRIATEIIG